MNPARELQKLIQRSGLTNEKVSKAAGYSHASGIQRYVSDDYDEPFFSRKVVQKLAEALVGKGTPPITAQEVYDLGGLTAPSLSNIVTGGKAYDPRSHKKHTKSGLSESETGLQKDTDHDLIIVRELDIRAVSGTNAGLVDVMESNEDEVTVAHHGFPQRGFREVYGAEPDQVRVAEIKGDSMFPTLSPGQKVMVDLSDRSPSPPGIFYVFDGLGMVVKRVQYLPNSEPPKVRIMSDNPAYESYERTLDEAHIQGRVIAGWRRM